ncbi:MAG: porin [Rhizobiaceae bacterium]|nr:porin [Rhizobiaceae bacterium]
MNIKSLLIGSAALATASTGAMAADAIVVADPEPMEYVRICDVYGAGFFYIPGTETCLKIGGYMRYQININAAGFTKLARFTPTFDVRSDTSIGTLRGYAEIEINWQNGTRPGIVAGAVAPVTGYGTDINPAHVYIQIIRGSHSWRFGRTHSPWSSYLGYALFGTADLGVQFNNTQEISYTFTGSNGFSFVAALVDDQDANFVPNVELGFKFERGWGHIGLVAKGDFDGTGVGSGHGVKGSLLVRFGNSGVSWKTQATFLTAAAGATAGLSAVTGFNFQFTPKFGMYIQGGVIAGTGVVATLGANITPVTNFYIRPEVTLAGGAFGASIRLNRSF